MDRSEYEHVIEDILLRYTAKEARSGLDPNYLKYCTEQANQYEQKKEVEELLVACGYVTKEVVALAWDKDSSKDRAIFNVEMILGLGLWHRGVLANLGEDLLKDAYQALVRWWSKLCTALRRMTKLHLEDECARAITLSTDLTLASFA